MRENRLGAISEEDQIYVKNRLGPVYQAILEEARKETKVPEVSLPETDEIQFTVSNIWAFPFRRLL